MSLSPQQEAAAKAVKAWLAEPEETRRPFFYLAGYAGSGKTTLARILAEDAGFAVYAAFTGKAALVLESKGCKPASTIHSLIYKLIDESADGEPKFGLNTDPDAPVRQADLIVIDEVSMVGPELGRDLLSFGRPVLVLGDPAQLPPVDGAGFFTAGEPDFMLTEIHRQAADNPIIHMSMIVREGGKLEIGAYGDSRVIRRDSLGARTALAADMILCGVNKTRRTKNAAMRKLLGHEGRFVVGERVITLKNNRENGVLNGGLWSVEEIEYADSEETEMSIRSLDRPQAPALDVVAHHAWLEGREREIDRDAARRITPLDYAYVLSVHKAQGSQWDNVLVIDESYIFKEDRARHLYTAITRAAERVTVAV